MRLADRLFGPGIPTALAWTLLFYVAHVFCVGWIASSESFLALAIIACAISWWRGEIRVEWHPVYFPLMLFLFGSALSAFATPHPARALFQIGEWFSFCVFVLAVSLYRTVPRMDKVGPSVFLALGFFLALYGMFQYFVEGYGHSPLDTRIKGPTAHVMTLSGIVLPIALMLLIDALDRKRPLVILGALLTTLVLVLTFTRGAWIGWIAGFATIPLRRRVRGIYWLAPIAVIAITFAPMSVFSRFISSADVAQSSNLDRIRMAQAGIEIIRDHPVLGVGPNGVKSTYPLYRKHDAPRFKIPHLHNNVLQLWAERGVTTLAAYLLLMATVLRECWRVGPGEGRARVYADAGIAIVVALFVAGLFEFNFGDTEVLLTTLNLFAFLLAGIERQRALAIAPGPLANAFPPPPVVGLNTSPLDQGRP